MTRKQAGGRLPATTALHDEEAGRGRLPAPAALHVEEAGRREAPGTSCTARRGSRQGEGSPPRVFTIFRILEISYISNVFLYFVYYSKVATISRK
jgi:hypothetical protein